MSQPLLYTLFRYKTWANVELFAEMRKLDPEAHQTERHTAIRLMNHIYVVDRIFEAHLTGRTHPYTATNTPETPTLEALQAEVAALDQWFEDYVQTRSAADLAESVAFTFTDGTTGCMTREEMLAHIVTHGGYHRGAVGRIMAQVAVPPPRDILTAYLHRTQPARREGIIQHS
ncbi:putative damage-inducible protein DinB [Chitinivorax tropicus]|uniref:Putative damage-inducible protein DinB n=1 Tax=Chitinivorax tropicus TaxID=714531 RepID=A0A840MI72_9PROT|nr:DinB family protein [Chitinivorax tropicus]MBB5018348.1 putative damage-inducible protein DinB [Chitinivorax tropicus]